VADGFLVTEQTVKLIQEVVRREMRRPRNTSHGDQVFHDLGATPDRLYAYFETAGLSGMTYSGSDPFPSPGSWSPNYAADKQLYMIDHVGTAPARMDPVPGMVVNVYNISRVTINAPTFIPVSRDKFGSWSVDPTAWFSQQVGTGSAGCGTTVQLPVGMPTCNSDGTLSQTFGYLCARLNTTTGAIDLVIY
jgi:hypothetical protein